MKMTESLSPVQCSEMRQFLKFLIQTRHKATVNKALFEWRKEYGLVRLSDEVMARRIAKRQGVMAG